MKILLANDYGYPVGGAESYFFQVAAGLKARGHEVYTASSNSTAHGRNFHTDFQLGHTGHYKNLDSIFSLENFSAFKRLLKQISPEVVHFNNVIYALSPAVLAAAIEYAQGTKASVKTLATLHDYSAICLGDKTLRNGQICRQSFGPSCMLHGCGRQPGTAQLLLQRATARRYLRKLDLRISPSKYLQQEYSQAGLSSVALSHPCPTLLPNSEEMTRSPSHLLYLGRLEPQKGVSILLKAFAILDANYRSTYPDLSLTIAGSGSQLESLKNLAAELGVLGAVNFCGKVDSAARDQLMSESSLLVVPSLWPEVSGLVALEAMSRGLPVIASNLGGLPENIIDGVTGFLVEHNNPEELAKKIELALAQNNGQFASSCTNFAKNFSLDLHLSKLEQLYIETQVTT